ncbi:MAG: HAD-IB family phosphatase [Methanomassiliicoccales archaeon]|nr:HAD-IB family phosphatase [Methanomassiliicoccales archaeon]
MRESRPRKYDLVAFDMDGVLVRYPSSWTWVHHHFGVTNETALEAYMQGQIDDREFMRRDISLWIERKEDLCKADIDRILEDLPVTEGIDDTVSILKREGIKTAIVSGGLDSVARGMSERYGFEGWIANGLEYDRAGRLTGEGILRVELMNKRAALDSVLKLWGIGRERTVCVGNSFVDVSMFEECGLKIAYNPIDDIVSKKADIVINAEDLRSILPFILD